VACDRRWKNYGSGRRVEGVQLRTGPAESRLVVSAVPAPALLKMLPESLVVNEPVFQRASNFNPHRSFPFICGLTNRSPGARLWVCWTRKIQWLFNKSAIFSAPGPQKGYVSW